MIITRAAIAIIKGRISLLKGLSTDLAIRVFGPPVEDERIDVCDNCSSHDGCDRKYIVQLERGTNDK